VSDDTTDARDPQKNALSENPSERAAEDVTARLLADLRPRPLPLRWFIEAVIVCCVAAAAIGVQFALMRRAVNLQASEDRWREKRQASENDWQEQMSQRKSEVERLETKIGERRQELTNVEAKIENAEQVLGTKQEPLAKHNAEIAAKKKELADVQQQLQDESPRLQQEKAKLFRTKEDIESAQQDLDALNKKIGQVEQLAARRDDLLKQIAAAEIRREGLKSNISTELENLRGTDKIKARVLAENKLLAGENKILKKTKKDLSDSLEDLRALEAKLKEGTASLVKRVAVLTANQEKKEKAVASAEERNRAAAGISGGLQEKKANLEKEIERLRGTIATLKKDKTDFDNQREQGKLKAKTAVDDEATARKGLALVRQQATAARNELKGLEASLRKTEKKLALANAQLNLKWAQKRAAELGVRLREKKDDLDDTEKELAKLNRTMPADQQDDHQKKRAARSRKVVALEGEIRRLERESEQKDKEVKSLESEIELKQNALSALDQPGKGAQ